MEAVLKNDRCRFIVGDKVDVSDYDKSERIKIGSPAIVLMVKREKCQSGFMVMIRGATDSVRTLDSDWLNPFKEKHDTPPLD